jgi:methionine-rich copper-binding protein CopC
MIDYRNRSFFLMAITVCVIMIGPRLAHAHAFPSAEDPKVGSTLETPPTRVVITFDSPIESLFAKLAVVGPSGDDETAGAPAVDANTRQLSVPLRALKPGEYTVRWSVVAEDSHRTEGSYTFDVAGSSQ